MLNLDNPSDFILFYFQVELNHHLNYKLIFSFQLFCIYLHNFAHYLQAYPSKSCVVFYLL